MSFYTYIFRNLLIGSCSNKAMVYANSSNYPEFHILNFILNLIRLLGNFKTASLSTPSIIPESFSSIDSVVSKI